MQSDAFDRVGTISQTDDGSFALRFERELSHPPEKVWAALTEPEITAVSQSAATWRAERRADRERARDLLSQIVSASAALETEKAAFRERRDSWRANALATGQALMELAAAHEDGNWLRGAASGVASLREWDAAEGARFVERMQAAAARLRWV